MQLSDAQGSGIAHPCILLKRFSLRHNPAKGKKNRDEALGKDRGGNDAHTLFMIGNGLKVIKELK